MDGGAVPTEKSHLSHAPVPRNGTIRTGDSRAGGAVTALVGNITATATATAQTGFLTASPAGAARPLASNVNPAHPGHTRPGLAITAVGQDKQISIYTSGQVHVIVDTAGWFIGPATAPQVAAAPASPAATTTTDPPPTTTAARVTLGTACTGSWPPRVSAVAATGEVAWCTGLWRAPMPGVTQACSAPFTEVIGRLGVLVWCVAEPATDTHFVFLEIPVPVEPATPGQFGATNGDRCSEFMAVEQGLMHGATTPRATVRMFCWAGYWRYNEGADPECRAPQTVLAGPSGVLDLNGSALEGPVLPKLSQDAG